MLHAEVETSSILLKNELVSNTLEYAPNKMICIVFGIQLLIIHEWEMVKILEDTNLGNNHYGLYTMPGFHIDSFPFLVCTGRGSINLVNVREKEMSIFIQAPCRAYN